MFGGIPFEHFAHGGGGGMPGGMGGRGGGEPADTTKLYEVLGVEKTADEKEIKKAYRKLAYVEEFVATRFYCWKVQVSVFLMFIPSYIFSQLL